MHVFCSPILIRQLDKYCLLEDAVGNRLALRVLFCVMNIRWHGRIYPILSLGRRSQPVCETVARKWTKTSSTSCGTRKAWGEFVSVFWIWQHHWLDSIILTRIHQGLGEFLSMKPSWYIYTIAPLNMSEWVAYCNLSPVDRSQVSQYRYL